MEDWKVGGLALCIKQGQWQSVKTGSLLNYGPQLFRDEVEQPADCG